MDFNDELTTFGEFVKGTCELMCPASERIMRERERLVHPLERQTDPHSLDLGKEIQSKTKGHPKRGNHDRHKADPAKTVKAFSRSAAGMKMPSPSDLRPFPVLESTVSYLIEKIACIGVETLGWIDRYNFVTDRLRAIRQDMVIQGLPPAECIKLLQPMVKFHVFGAYWLCENSIQLFDPKINASFLQECIKRLLVMYDAIRNTNRKTLSRNSSQDAEISMEKRTTCNSSQHLMEALYLIINLGDYQALSRSLTRLEVFNECQSCVERTAFHLSLASWKGEYVRVCRHIRKLNPLLCMAAALHLPSIRRSALLVMATAFNSKSQKFPLDILCELLLWNDSAHASSECQYYGLKVEKSSDTNYFVGFEKASFNANIRSIGPTRVHWVDRNLSSKAVAEMLKES